MKPVCVDAVWQRTGSAAVFVLLPALLLGTSGCHDLQGPADVPSDPAFIIVDGANGGNGHFYFLPPLVPAPSFNGEFDPYLIPVVTVCELAGGSCATEVASFTTGAGPGQIAVDVAGEAYSVSWQTRGSSLSTSAMYRMLVRVGTRILGYADLQFVARNADLAGVPAGVIGAVLGRPLVIKFRIEFRALGSERILFSSVRDGNGELYAVYSNGVGLVNLTNYPAAHDGPGVWSPDGLRITFDSDRNGNYDVFVMNQDGTGVRALTGTSYWERGAVWSPDGTRVAVEQMRDGGACDWRVLIIEVDGNGLTDLTGGPLCLRGYSWSPDGTQLAISHAHSDGSWEIWVYQADGSGGVRITDTAGNNDLPVWSPDGTRIAFRSTRDGNTELYVMNTDGSGQTRLTDNVAVDGGARWSPDGSRIAFYTDRDGTVDIYVMNADGTAQTPVASLPTSDQLQVWSPEGTRLAFTAVNLPMNQADVWLVNVDGTALRNLTNNPAWNGGPSWRR